MTPFNSENAIATLTTAQAVEILSVRLCCHGEKVTARYAQTRGMMAASVSNAISEKSHLLAIRITGVEEVPTGCPCKERAVLFFSCASL